MNNEIIAIKLKIDITRNKLYKLTSRNNLTDSCVVECSQVLDKLLNQYDKGLSQLRIKN